MREYFVGRRVQRGSGLGSIFASLFRRATPFIKTGAKYLARQGLKTGSKIVEDLLEGEDLKTSAQRNLKRMHTNVKRDVKRNLLKRMKGGGYVVLKKNMLRKGKNRKMKKFKNTLKGRNKRRKTKRRRVIKTNNSQHKKRKTTTSVRDVFFT